MAVQQPSQRLHHRGLFFHPLNGTKHGSQPSMTPLDRELVSVLEVRIEPGDLKLRPWTPQFLESESVFAYGHITHIGLILISF